MPLNRFVKIALIQLRVSANPEKNLQHALKQIRAAAKKGANIVCLPELFKTYYFPQDKKRRAYFGYAEPIPGPTSKTLSSIAKELKIVLVGGSIFEKSGRKFYNTAVIFNEKGEQLGKFRKVHIPHDPNFYEQHYFSAGDDFKVFKTKYGKISVLICYDQWFPEAARICALKGAEIIFYPTAIGSIKGVKQGEGNWYDAWQTVQRGHGIANGVFIAAVNRVGIERRLNFLGGSFVSGPFGTILAKAGHKKPQILFAKCNLSECAFVREGWRFFHNRRPGTYKLLLKK